MQLRFCVGAIALVSVPTAVVAAQASPDNPRPEWLEINCAERNTHVHLGNENYFTGADGLLMPAKKNQKPPDLKWFRQPKE